MILQESSCTAAISKHCSKQRPEHFSSSPRAKDLPVGATVNRNQQSQTLRSAHECYSLKGVVCQKGKRVDSHHLKVLSQKGNHERITERFRAELDRRKAQGLSEKLLRLQSATSASLR